VAFAGRPGPGTHLGLVRGRRRQGKSFLLRRLARALGGFYFQAAEEERTPALAGFGAAMGEHLRVPGGRLAVDSWESALRALEGLATDRPVLAVLDEFPYLLGHSPELPSLLQRAIDRSRDGGSPLRLILCGSALSVMSSLLTGSRALHGRAALDLVVRAFDYRTSAAFWGLDNRASAFFVHAVLGRTPGYRDLLPAPPPARAVDVDRWLLEGPLNPSSALFREDDFLLAQERSLTDRSLYHSVVAAIARGNTSQGAIASALGREQRAVQHPLKALEEAGFVTRTDDMLRSRRPIYRVADPIVRFHHVITRRDLARFEERRAAEAWRDARPRFLTHVLGPHFEDTARGFAFRYAITDTLGGPAVTVGPAVLNDPLARTQHELDVVVLGRDKRGTAPVLALGEAKYTQAKRSPADLTRLEHLRALIATKDPSAASARLLVFSASGFERNLTALAARRKDVELIDLERLYSGS